jgi:hypothetical protein
MRVASRLVSANVANMMLERAIYPKADTLHGGRIGGREAEEERLVLPARAVPGSALALGIGVKTAMFSVIAYANMLLARAGELRWRALISWSRTRRSHAPIATP